MRSNLRSSAARDRAPERRLADAGRADEAEDRAARVRLQPPHGEELEDAVLDLLDVVVVGVEHLARVLEVEVVLGRRVPRQRRDPLQVGADHAVLGRRLRQLLEPRELAVGDLADVLGQLDLGELLAQLLDLGLGRVALAELLLDRLELLAQHVLALGLVELGLHLRLDARADRDDLELAREDLRQPPQPLGDVALLEQLLLLLGLDPQRAGDQVRERRRVVEVGDRHLQLLGEVRDLLDDARERLLDVAHQRGQLGALLDDVGRLGDARDEVGRPRVPLVDADALAALDEDPQRPVGHLEHARDGADDADVVELVGRRATRPRGRGWRPSRACGRRASTSLTSWIERSWPTASGVSVSGKVTVSRSGSTGSCAGSGGRAHRHGSPPSPSASMSITTRRRRRLAGGAGLDRDRVRVGAAPATGSSTDEHAVLVDRPRGVGVDLGAERDDAPERPVLDLELLVEALLVLRRAPRWPAEDQLAPADLEVDVGAGRCRRGRRARPPAAGRRRSRRRRRARSRRGGAGRRPRSKTSPNSSSISRRMRSKLAKRSRSDTSPERYPAGRARLDESRRAGARGAGRPPSAWRSAARSRSPARGRRRARASPRTRRRARCPRRRRGSPARGRPRRARRRGGGAPGECWMPGGHGAVDLADVGPQRLEAGERLRAAGEVVERDQRAALAVRVDEAP